MGMREFVSLYSNKNAKFYNDDILINLKKNDNMITYLSEVCDVVAKMASDNIKYLGCYYEDDEKKARELNKGKETIPTNNKKITTVNIQQTYAKLACFKFECSYKGVKQIKVLSLWVPILVDNCHFSIKGKKYSAPLQIVDAITFSNKTNILILKTMTRAIKLNKTKYTLQDIYGQQYPTNVFTISNKSTQIPVLLYYFSYYGFFKTLQFFGLDDIVKVYSGDPFSGEGIPKDKIMFKFGEVYLGVKTDNFNDNVLVRQLVACIVSSCKRKRNVGMDFIRNPSRWQSTLGEYINPMKASEKGAGLLKTFINSLDFRTMTVINQLVEEGNPKTNIFTVMRWMMIRFNQLALKDNGLQNKRIKFNEYLISPFVKEICERMYRFINYSEKSKSLEKLLDVFKISNTIIIDSIIGKISPQKTGMNVVKFSESTNDNTMAGPLTEYTFAGPGSPMEKVGARASSTNNRFTPDFVGNLCIVTAANTSPGIVGQIIANAPIDPEKKIFLIDKELIKYN